MANKNLAREIYETVICMDRPSDKARSVLDVLGSILQPIVDELEMYAPKLKRMKARKLSESIESLRTICTKADCARQIVAVVEDATSHNRNEVEAVSACLKKMFRSIANSIRKVCPKALHRYATKIQALYDNALLTESSIAGAAVA